MILYNPFSTANHSGGKKYLELVKDFFCSICSIPGTSTSQEETPGGEKRKKCTTATYVRRICINSKLFGTPLISSQLSSFTMNTSYS